MPYFITTLTSMGERLYAGDLMDNVSFLKYREGTNQLVEFADGAIPRSITCMDLLDYNTVVCGDKVQKGTTFINTVSKHEVKPYGKFIDNLYCNMFAKGITISPEDLKNLLKYYDIIEKPQEA